MYPPVPAEKRKPIRVLSLFDGIATGGSMGLGAAGWWRPPRGRMGWRGELAWDRVGKWFGMEHNGKTWDGT